MKQWLYSKLTLTHAMIPRCQKKKFKPNLIELLKTMLPMRLTLLPTLDCLMKKYLHDRIQVVYLMKNYLHVMLTLLPTLPCLADCLMKKYLHVRIQVAYLMKKYLHDKKLPQNNGLRSKPHCRHVTNNQQAQTGVCVCNWHPTQTTCTKIAQDQLF